MDFGTISSINGDYETLDKFLGLIREQILT